MGDYLDGIDESDAEDLREFINSRRVVNGTDKAALIGGYALAFERALKAAGYRPRKAVPAPSTPAKPSTPPAPASDGWLAAFRAVLGRIFTKGT